MLAAAVAGARLKLRVWKVNSCLPYEWQGFKYFSYHLQPPRVRIRSKLELQEGLGLNKDRPYGIWMV